MHILFTEDFKNTRSFGFTTDHNSILLSDLMNPHYLFIPVWGGQLHDKATFTGR